jgi:hypothetical protein
MNWVCRYKVILHGEKHNFLKIRFLLSDVQYYLTVLWDPTPAALVSLHRYKLCIICGRKWKLVTDGVTLYDDDDDDDDNTYTVSKIISLHIHLKNNLMFAFYVLKFIFI